MSEIIAVVIVLVMGVILVRTEEKEEKVEVKQFDLSGYKTKREDD